MQLTAPSSSLAPHAGQVVGSDGALGADTDAGGCGGRAVGGGGCGGRLGAGGAGGRAAGLGPADGADRAAAWATGCWAGAGATKAFLQNGQRNCLPAEPSASCICCLQCGQLIT